MQNTSDISKISSKKIFDLFKSYRTFPFIFIEPKENYGGILIWKGAQKLANLAGIAFQSVAYQEFMKFNFPDDAVIYLHGGGGANLIWPNSGVVSSFLSIINSHKGIIIVGPQTYQAVTRIFPDNIKSILRETKAKKIYIFARDQVSYQELKTYLPNNVEISIDHDTALNLSISDFETLNLKNNYKFYSIRQDKEKVNLLERDFFAVWIDPVHECHSFSEWVNIHAKARVIITNRLHSAILGSILEKITILLPNSYYKNRAVWEYSLQQRGVQWEDNINLSSSLKIINKISILTKIFDSYKFQKVVQVFNGIKLTE